MTIFTREQLLEEHAYARPHAVGGQIFHGGFLADDTYASPRTLGRDRAVKAWNIQLLERGGSLIDITCEILPEPTYPNLAQVNFLHRLGLDQTLWTWVTSTAVIESRAAALCQMSAPDFQAAVSIDISAMGLAHLNKGLLWAHGADEAGDPGEPLKGGHDLVWLAVRDLAFPGQSHVSPQFASVNSSLPSRDMPAIPLACEHFLKFMMGVLVVEVRAESFFSLCVAFLRDPKNIITHREGAELAAMLVEHIRQDEDIHVRYLQTLLSEARSLEYRTDKGLVLGASFMDPVWNRIRSVVRSNRRQVIRATALVELQSRLGSARGHAALAEFDELGDPTERVSD